MVSVSPAKFPAYTKRQIRLHNLLAIYRPQITPEINGEPLALLLGAGPRPSHVVHTLGLIAAGTRLWIDLEEGFFRRLTTPWLGEEVLESLPEALRAAVTIASMTPLLDQLEFITGSGLSLAQDNSPVPEHALGVSLWPTSASPSMSVATLWLDSSAVETLIDALQRMSTTENDWSGLPLRLSLLAAQTRLRLKELRDLEPNDLVLLPSGSMLDTLLVAIRSSYRPLAAARLEGATLTIESLLESSMYENDPSDDMDSPQPGNDPEDLELRLDFDLGQVTVTLGELQSIQPGYSFELDMPVSGSVRILCGGKIIGHGQLVQIDDRLGVRVTELFNSGDA